MHNQKNTYLWFCSVRLMGASDPHSGVKRIKYRFKALSTGKVINNRDFPYYNPPRVSTLTIRHIS